MNDTIRQGMVWLRKIVRRRALVRLMGEISAYEIDLSPKEDSADLTRVRAAVRQATDATSAGLVDMAWRCLHAARRLEILTLNDAELQALGSSMRKEASKLNGWRQETFTELLTPPAGQPVTRENILRAAEIRDGHYDNEAYKDSLRRGSALRLAAALTLGLVALLWLVTKGNFQTAVCNIDAFVPATSNLPQSAATPAPDCAASGLGSVFWSVMVMGFLGAVVSAVTDSPVSQASSRVPEITSTVRVTILRLLIGPTSAVVLFFLLHSDLYNKFISIKPGGYTMMLIAFAAGFSERLVMRVIALIVNGGSSESPPPAPAR